MARCICFDSIILKISREKVEKVVKPPHSPVLKSKFKLSSVNVELIIPINKEPMKFINKVKIGNSMFTLMGIWLNKYLNPDPINPPHPTIKKLINKSTSINKKSQWLYKM